MGIRRNAAVLRGVPQPSGTVNATIDDLAVCEEELFELETELMKAVKKQDVDYLHWALGERFVLTTS